MTYDNASDSTREVPNYFSGVRRVLEPQQEDHSSAGHYLRQLLQAAHAARSCPDLQTAPGLEVVGHPTMRRRDVGIQVLAAVLREHALERPEVWEALLVAVEHLPLADVLPSYSLRCGREACIGPQRRTGAECQVTVASKETRENSIVTVIRCTRRHTKQGSKINNNM
jgi:hypothetical protein